MFDKLDELLEKLDKPAEEVEDTPAEEVKEDAPIADNVEQVSTPEDAHHIEAIEKLSMIVDKQQEYIDNLNKQIAQLVKGGANINDGEQAKEDIVREPDNVPEDYVYLKDLDYSM